MTKKKGLGLRVFLYIIFFMLGLTYVIFTSITSKKERSKYEHIYSYDSLECRVLETEQLRGTTLFGDTKGNYYSLNVIPIKNDNIINQDIIEFFDVLQPGDSLFKASKCDTVFLIKSNTNKVYLYEFFF